MIVDGSKQSISPLTILYNFFKKSNPFIEHKIHL